MAIKGKKRSKPRPVSRAPRREPVPMPTPVWRRRWVQVTASFLLGIGLVWLLVVVTNSMRAGREADEEAAEASKRRAAAQAWQNEVRSTLGTVAEGGLPTDGTPPTVFPELATAVQQVGTGNAPESAANTLGDLSTRAEKVAEDITAFDLSGTIADQGFDTGGVLRFLSSQQGFASALTQYARAAALGEAAATTNDAGAQKELSSQASTIANDAAQSLQTAWVDYTEALGAGGIQIVAAPGTFPGATGSSPFG